MQHLPELQKDPVAGTSDTGRGTERYPQLRVHRVVWEGSQGLAQKLGNGIEIAMFTFVSGGKLEHIGECLPRLWIHTMCVLAYMAICKVDFSLTSCRNTISHSFIPSHFSDQNRFQGNVKGQELTTIALLSPGNTILYFLKTKQKISSI